MSSIISPDWLCSPEGESILNHFYNQNNGRKMFGILERPNLPSHIEQVSYKIFLTGKAGSGKSAIVAKLAGHKIPSVYQETQGIAKTNIYWPVKIWDKIILFKLQFWDAGYNNMKRFSHILPACREKADGILLIFSYMDPSSLNELSSLINKFLPGDDPPAIITIGNRNVTSSQTRVEISSAQVREFENKWQTQVLKLDNRSTGSENTNLLEVAPILNAISERLWLRDQEYLLKEGLC